MVDSNVGREIDGYQILEVVGRGGMGTVYKAEDTALSRLVALKCLNPGLADDESFLDRFRSEARAIARVNSPYIVQVYTLSETEIGLVIIMEYVEGGTLKQRIDAGETDWKDSLPLIQQMLTALQHAHGAGVIHRDIKPQNILLSDIVLAHGTRVKMTDFGLAKTNTTGDPSRTVTQGVYGTLYYMSPEQAEGLGQVDHRSDIYSLGMTCYEMLAGRLPFEENSSEYTIMRTIVEGNLPELNSFAPNVPDELHDIVMTAVAKDPEERFQSAAEMQKSIGELEESSDRAHPEREPPTVTAGLDAPLQGSATRTVLKDELSEEIQEAPSEQEAQFLPSSYWQMAGIGVALAVTLLSTWYFAGGLGASPVQTEPEATAITNEKIARGDTAAVDGVPREAAMGEVPPEAEPSEETSGGERPEQRGPGGGATEEESTGDTLSGGNATGEDSGQSANNPAVNEPAVDEQSEEQAASTAPTEDNVEDTEATDLGAANRETADRGERQEENRRSLPSPIDTLAHINDPSVLSEELQKRESKFQLTRGTSADDFFTPSECYVFVVKARKVVAVLGPETNDARIELRSGERVEDWTSMTEDNFTIWVSLTDQE